VNYVATVVGDVADVAIAGVCSFVCLLTVNAAVASIRALE